MFRFVVLSVLSLLLWECSRKKDLDQPTPTRRRGVDITAQLAGIYTVTPSLRADGQGILYQSYTDGKLYLLVRPLGQDTGTPQAVTFASSVGTLLQAQLSPDGTTFLVIGVTAPNLYTLYLVDVATFTPKTVVQGTAQLLQLHYSADSQLFLYTQLTLEGDPLSFVGRVSDPAGATQVSSSAQREMATAIYFEGGEYVILLQASDIDNVQSGFFPLSLAASAVSGSSATFTDAITALQQSPRVSPWVGTYVVASPLPAAYVSQNSFFLWAAQNSTNNFKGLGSSPDLTADPTLGLGELIRSPSYQIGLSSPYTIASAEWPLGFQTLKASVSGAEDGLLVSVDREFHVCNGQSKYQAVYGTGFVLRTQSDAGVVTKTWMFPTSQNTVGIDPCQGIGSAQSLWISSIALHAQAVHTAWRGVFTWAAGTTLQQGVLESVNGQTRVFMLP